jgi:hypothetical protein
MHHYWTRKGISEKTTHLNLKSKILEYRGQWHMTQRLHLATTATHKIQGAGTGYIETYFM